MNNFIHLHNHTDYSLLDGLSKVDEYRIKANKLGMSALAITDHGNMRHIYQLQYKSNKKFMFKGQEWDLPPIKPIFGIEFYVAPKNYKKKGISDKIKEKVEEKYTDKKERKEVLKKLNKQSRKRYHLCAWAKSQIGLENLFTLQYLSFRDGFYYRPRIDMNILKKYKEGLLIGSACTAGYLPGMINENKLDKAEEFINDMLKNFGDDFYLEIMPQDDDEQREANKQIIDFAYDKNIKVIATNDCHYLNKEDYKSHEVLLAIQSNDLMRDPDRWKFSATEFYFKDYVDMFKSFKRYHSYLSEKDIKKSLENTSEIADKCHVELKLDRKKGILPNFSIPDKFKNHDQYLIQLIKDGWKWRNLKKNIKEYAELHNISVKESQKIYKERLKNELKRIIGMNFTKYFLVIWDMVNYARKNGIVVGPGRGSSASSLTCYLLGITSVDPIKYDLLFDRFLSKKRIDYPDIDVDFQDNRRDEVFEYLVKKYGEKYSTRVGTLGTMKGKMCMLDVGRVFEVPIKETLEVNKHIIERSSGDARVSETVEDSFKEFDVCKKYNKKYPQILPHVKRMEGTRRNCGVHAAGIELSDKPIHQIVPIEHRKSGDKWLKTGSLSWVEDQGVGLVKLDVLGLKTLTVLKTALENIEKRCGKQINLEKINLEDKNVLQNFTDTNFAGIFQFDSIGMTNTCKILEFTNFEDIVSLNALYRPGTLRSGLTHKYINRKLGKEKVEKLHPVYDKFTKPTYGILVYQEQLIRCFVEIGDYEPETADELRKKVAKAAGVEMLSREKETFVNGAIKKGLKRKKAEELFVSMAFFGSYSFNKSHAAAYATIAFWGMYLKTYYPIEFYQALLEHEDKQDEMKKFINDAKKNGIQVKYPDVNESGKYFRISGKDTIITGLTDIKGVGEKAANFIVECQPFTSMADFCSKVDRRKVHRGVIGSLVKAKAFNSLYEDFGALYKQLDDKQVWESMLDLDEQKGNELYEKHRGTNKIAEDDDMLILSSVCPIAMAKHTITYYEWINKYLDKRFTLGKLGEIDWDLPRIRFAAIMLDIKYNNIGDFHKEEPDEKIKKRIRWGQRYANINFEDETGMHRAMVDISIFPGFRHIIDKGDGTPVLVSAKLWKQGERMFVDCIADLENMKSVIRQDGKFKDKFKQLSEYEKYFIKHPIEYYKKRIDKKFTPIKRIAKKGFIGRHRIIGLILRIKKHWTKKQDKLMYFVDIEDETGSVDCVVWNEVVVNYKNELKIGNIVKADINKSIKGTFLNGIDEVVTNLYKKRG